jgi:PBP1b-binding outer membrane lipoprotein LpoB
MAFGKQIGRVIVCGPELHRRRRSLAQSGSKFEDTRYLLVLNAVNVETGELMWSDKGEIRRPRGPALQRA